MEDELAQILNANNETDTRKEVAENPTDQSQKDDLNSHPGSKENSLQINVQDGDNTSKGATQGNEGPYGEFNMEAAISADDVLRAGGFGARDGISSVLPVASDSTDFEESLLDARGYEDPQEEIQRPGLGYSKRQQEAEMKLVEEETAKRVEAAIKKKVEESLNCEEIKLEIHRRLGEGRKKLHDEVAAQLEKEKENAIVEAKRREEQARKEKEELERMLEENRRKVEEAQRKEALEQQRREEERYRELEERQRQREEALRRKKMEEEEERANQMKLLGKNKTRPKLSFALGMK